MFYSTSSDNPTAAERAFQDALAALHLAPGSQDLLKFYAHGIVAAVQAAIWDQLPTLSAHVQDKGRLTSSSGWEICHVPGSLQGVAEFCFGPRGNPRRYHMALVRQMDEYGIKAEGDEILRLLITALEPAEDIMRPSFTAPDMPVPLEKLPTSVWLGMVADLNEPFLFSREDRPEFLAGLLPVCKPVLLLYALEGLCSILCDLGLDRFVTERATELAGLPVGSRLGEGYRLLLKAGLEQAWMTNGHVTARTIAAVAEASLELNALQMDHAWRTQLDTFHFNLFATKRCGKAKALTLANLTTSVYATYQGTRRILHCRDGDDCYRVALHDLGDFFELRIWEDSLPDADQRLLCSFGIHDGRFAPHPKYKAGSLTYRFSPMRHAAVWRLIDTLRMIEELHGHDLADQCAD